MDTTVAKAILRWEYYEDVDFFEEVQAERITDSSRWDTLYEAVYRDTRDGTFWRIEWFRGSTEYQDEGPENIYVNQVHPVEVTVVEYRLGAAT